MRKIIILILFPLLGFSQSEKKFCETLAQVNKLILENHFKPKSINDSLSAYVFETFLENLDSNNSLFLASDINELKKHKFKIDNYINSNKCDFINEFYKIYSKAFDRNKQIISAITSEPITYSSNEIIKFSKKRKPYCADVNELKKYFRKRILFDILSDVSQISTNKDSLIQNFTAIANSSKKKVLDNFKCNINDEILTQEAFNALFINAFCSYFDPHTVYFSNSEKSDFLSGLSSTNYSFGLNFQINEKNDLVVESIIPFGPAYYSNKIEANDVLQKIKIDTVEYKTNCDFLKKASEIINSNATKTAVFNFRKKNGALYNVTLQKQLLPDYENSVYSYILEKDNVKTGYVKIPSFYSKFENGKTNVSDDVKREILKFKDQKISNLIIDLENNGGGSMDEAIKLCGLFINAPVLAENKYSNNKIFLEGNQNNSKTIYSGSIIVLINGYSASASEFFANAMQDYSMAIVVGSKSFGKGSMQSIFPIENESKDFLKVTIGCFFRVTGKSHQRNGIVPNILIPKVFDNQIEREKNEKQALKNEVIASYINSNVYPYSEKQKNIIEQYNLESKKYPDIQKIISLQKRVDLLFGDNLKPVKLNFKNVFDYLATYRNLWNDVEKFVKTDYDFQVLTTNFESETSKKNLNVSKSDKIGVKELKSNYTISESIKILNRLCL